jgi:hypothetical protein
MLGYIVISNERPIGLFLELRVRFWNCHYERSEESAVACRMERRLVENSRSLTAYGPFVMTIRKS